jgi:hypothetical protein
MWPVQALVNPGAALGLFDDAKILADEYPAELSMAYYMIQAMQSYQYKVDDAFMRIHPFVSSSIYLNASNQRVALVYNSSTTSQTVTFVVGQQTQTHTVGAKDFTTIELR